MKVYVYAICKNEERFVERWAQSMNEADSIFVTDTGSTDNTIEKLETLGVTVSRTTIEPWDFSLARNFSLSQVPIDADICVCTDLDEEFEPGWRAKLEKQWIPGLHKQANYIFNWSVNPDGTPGSQFIYFKIHSRNDYIWKYPVHEVLNYIGPVGEETKVFVDGIVLNHYPDNTKSRGGYLALLERGAETIGDHRMLYYLAREYTFVNEWEKCFKTVEQYFALPSNNWVEERAMIASYASTAKRHLGDMNACYEWGWYSIIEADKLTIREPFVNFAMSLYFYENWSLLKNICCDALKITERSQNFVNTAEAWGALPYDLLSLAYYNLGEFESAFSTCEMAVKLAPDDARIKKNLEFMRGKIFAS